MASKTPVFEIFPAAVKGPKKGQYFWRLRGRNGRIVMVGGEGFTHLHHAERAVNRVKELATAAVVTLVLK